MHARMHARTYTHAHIHTQRMCIRRTYTSAHTFTHIQTHLTYMYLGMICIQNLLVFSFLHILCTRRNRCISKSSIKDLKKAEAKVLIMCCWYVILGLGTTLGYSLSSAILDDLRCELLVYFECERCGVIAGQTCDRSDFEQYTNPPMVTVAYSLFHAYPLITLIYVLRIKRKPNTK
jgi:hypothetical protein